MSVGLGDPSGVPTLAAHFRDMAGNNRWSNARLHAACAALRSERALRPHLRRPRRGPSDDGRAAAVEAVPRRRPLGFRRLRTRRCRSAWVIRRAYRLSQRTFATWPATTAGATRACTRRAPRSDRNARFGRIYDGPDEVHQMTVARRLLKQYRDGGRWDFGD